MVTDSEEKVLANRQPRRLDPAVYGYQPPLPGMEEVVNA